MGKAALVERTRALGETDTCWTGRLSAPDHVLHGGEYFTEYLYRQPRSAAETALLVEAAECEVFGAYGCDGDTHWTPAAVRDWWRDRGRITRYLAQEHHDWADDPEAVRQGVRAGIRDFASYIDGELAIDLRVYMYWLEERRSPEPGNRLPDL
ncbi:ferredoxin [Embleya sp. NPDC127516]|uniref:ferredoxin n=1 Tax=Embleya sp. NPDC127516 TaxID=3363990 RepID=UPI00380506CC